MSDDLLRALIQGPGTRAGAGPRGGDPLSEMLQGLMGGGSLPGMAAEEESLPTQEMGGAPGLGGLLEGILGGGMAGAGAQPSGGAGTGGGLADILGAIMGGGMPGMETQPPAGTGSAGGLGDILGAILGGGAAGAGAQPSAGAGGGGLAGILGAILGGGATGGGQTNPVISGIVQGLAEKLGLPPQIAQIVVVFVMNKLLKRRAEAAAGPAQAAPRPQAEPQAEGLNLDGLLDMMNRGQTLRQADVRSSGMAEELARQTGLSVRDASASIAYVLNELGSEYGASGKPPAPSAPPSEGLKNLLDTW